MASRAKKISEYAIGVLSAGNTYFLGNVAGVTKRIAALASNLTFTPAGGIAATTVQAALEELDSEKFDKAGGTMTGALTVPVVMNAATLSTSTTIPADFNASMVGPLTVASGVTLTVTSGATLVFL